MSSSKTKSVRRYPHSRFHSVSSTFYPLISIPGKSIGTSNGNNFTKWHNKTYFTGLVELVSNLPSNIALKQKKSSDHIRIVGLYRGMWYNISIYRLELSQTCKKFNLKLRKNRVLSTAPPPLFFYNVLMMYYFLRKFYSHDIVSFITMDYRT